MHGLLWVKCHHKEELLLPLVNDLLKSVWGYKTFSKIDLKSAFNLLRVASGNEWKMAFRTNEGLFKYLVMPFRLTMPLLLFKGLFNGCCGNI